jgi:flavin-binding protein dodecin
MTYVAKIIEVVGNSDKSWQDAAQVASDEMGVRRSRI